MQQEAPAEPAAKAEPEQAPAVDALLTPPASPAREVNGVAVEGTCLGSHRLQPLCDASPSLPAQQQARLHVFLNTHRSMAGGSARMEPLHRTVHRLDWGLADVPCAPSSAPRTMRGSACDWA